MSLNPFAVVAPGPEEELVRRVRERIGRLRAYWEACLSDRKAAYDATRFLEEDEAQWLQPNPAEPAEHWRHKLKLCLNVANYLLRAVATTYVSPPHRVVKLGVVPEGLDEAGRKTRDDARHTAETWLDDHLWTYGEYGMDQTFLAVDRWVLYLGTVAVEPRFRPAAESEDGQPGVEPIYYRRHEFEVLPRSDDARRAEAVVLATGRVGPRFQSLLKLGVPNQTEVSHYWDDEVFCRLIGWEIDENQGVEADEYGARAPADARFYRGIFHHGLGYVPVRFVKDSQPQNAFYGPAQFVKLFPAAKALNKLWTEFTHVLRVQHGYPWATGEVTNQVMAPDALLKLEPGGTFGVATPGANLTGMLEGIQRELDNLAALFGLAPGSLRMDPHAAASGVSIVAERAETERVRKERVPMFRRFEARYHRAALDIFRVFGGAEGQAPAETSIEVAFQPPPAQISEAEVREKLAFERENRLVSRQQMLAVLEPDLSPEERQRRLAEVEEEQAADAAKAPPQPVAATPAPATPLDILSGMVRRRQPPAAPPNSISR